MAGDMSAEVDADDASHESARGILGFLGRKQRSSDVVADGIYIAAAATRLSLKNRILVEVLQGNEGFDVGHFLPVARDTLLALAGEAEDDAKRTQREKKAAAGRHSDPDGTHDYRNRDVRNLRRRRNQSLRIAKELRERAEDEEELKALVEAARDAAWGELAKNIDRSLRIEAARPDREPDYEQMRAARMQALVLVDLPKLKAHRRRAAKAVKDLAEDVALQVATAEPQTPQD